MRFFADTSYWIGLFSPRDELHGKALNANEEIEKNGDSVVTTEEVLSEFLNYFCDKGEWFRKEASQLVDGLNNDSRVEIIYQTHDSFLLGLELYKNRLDKSYSLTDCISMSFMRNNGLTNVLTGDDDFQQEGFVLRL